VLVRAFAVGLGLAAGHGLAAAQVAALAAVEGVRSEVPSQDVGSAVALQSVVALADHPVPTGPGLHHVVASSGTDEVLPLERGDHVAPEGGSPTVVTAKTSATNASHRAIVVVGRFTRLPFILGD
jgi:hypothetical protein